MAFRLAELRAAIDAATDSKAHESLKKEHEALVLALWSQRSTVPGGVAAEERLRKSLALLDILLGERDAWHRPPADPKGSLEAADAVFDKVKDVIRLAMLLEMDRGELAFGSEDPDLPLSDEERQIRNRMTDLRRIEVRNLLASTGRFEAGDVSPEESVVHFEKRVGSETEDLIKMIRKLRSLLLRKR